MSRSAVGAFLRQQEERIIEELCAFARIPSVSTDPAYGRHMGDAVDFVAALMREAGLEHVAVIATGGHPAIYADWLHAEGAPTILVYGHYDVQPPDPIAAWTSPPFEPVRRGERLYGRGVSDNKGPMLIPLKVAEAFMQSSGRLPLNVKFIIEGEEEVGSKHLEASLHEHRAMLAADFVLSADGARWRADLPAVNLASRGILVLEASLKTAATDLHSGRFGGTIANPLHLMARLVASLHDADGRVAVTGFYDGVRAPTRAEREAVAAVPFDEDAYLAATGASALVGEAGWTTLERNWLRPTLDLNGMWGGYQGAGSKTSIPSEAHAKISCRLVPGQEPAQIAAAIGRHLEMHCPPGGTVSMRWDGHGARAYEMPADHPCLAVTEQVLTEIHGTAPLRVRIGATLPVSEMFLRILGIDTLLFSFSTADEGFHGPNEFFRLQGLRDGLAAWARSWEILGTQKAELYTPFRRAPR
ncbi:MAG: dipeptidase [Alphaproteobacteria bacterium]|nr:dipeptidase [Alphaproteobacteria bacterium]